MQPEPVPTSTMRGLTGESLPLSLSKGRPPLLHVTKFKYGFDHVLGFRAWD